MHTMLTRGGLILSACLLASVSGQALAQTAFTEPSYDFGPINSFAVLNDPSHAGNTSTYAKQLSFSLDSASDVRLDLRYVWYSYRSLVTSGFYNESFKLYDSAHTLVGTGSLDSSFAGGYCTGEIRYQQCWANHGLTLATNLSAGNYSIEFSGTRDFGPYTPNLYFGVSKADAAAIDQYYKQITPAGAVPENSTITLMGLGLIGLLLTRRPSRQALDNTIQLSRSSK
ncbi:MAG TPA: hypothetical protein VFW93_06065 [Aquabacterium sp.]|uniref:hypothetical protein n=1 Tax=Aquabacterium sp. TaxID=1872578 RepID=UPI002E3215CA|nr:hypothetical protein [Aquabacterium sp.]HEX5355760.1 hypothetical protein [Aquabacterium sp.]